MNAGLSVSRVGGAAQIKAMRQVAGRLRLDLAAFRSLAAFAQFGSDLDPATQGPDRSRPRLTEILKQGQYQPMPVEEQVVDLWTATNGYLDDVPVEEVREFEAGFSITCAPRKADILLQTIASEKALSDELTEALQDRRRRLQGRSEVARRGAPTATRPTKQEARLTPADLSRPGG